MARDVDIVIESLGSNPFLPLGKAGIDTALYDGAIKRRNLKRTLLSISCGARELDSDHKALLAEIDKATGSDVQRIGALCLYGDSNGAGLVLAVAMTLQRRGAPRATYIGLGDLTIMPFGRRPPVPGIGSLQPTNAPQVSFGLKVNPISRPLAIPFPPLVRNGDPPRIADPGVVADKRENFFTAEGNRARIFTLSPAGADDWWWTSTMDFGEVHGEIPGWNNIRRTTVSNGVPLARGQGSIDDGHHIALCGMVIKSMRFQAGLELGGFITRLPA